MRLAILLTALLLAKSIAHSQITGIPLDNKKEILKTLLHYPLILDKVVIEKQKNNVLKDMLLDERKKKSIFESIIKNKDLEINNLENQKNQYDIQLKKNNSGLFMYGSIPMNNLASPEVGLMYQFKNKVGIMTGVQYNNITNQPDFKIGFLIRL